MSQRINLAELSERRELTDAQAEAQRVMTICNACRYCEGFCPVFPAMTRRRSFDAASLDYLANLCHNCTACYHACQYKPPHVFDLNVPQSLAAVRVESYERYAWPAGLARLFQKNGLVVSLTTALALAVVITLTAGFVDNETLYAVHQTSGAFYNVISHGLMVLVAGGTFGFALVALLIGGIRYWRANGLSGRAFINPTNLASAFKAAATLQHLGGGHGDGCNSQDESFSNLRRYYHQFTMWGFLSCFGATCVATIYEYGFGWMSPFDIFSLPVVLGTVGGVGLLIGPAGLLSVKLKADSTPVLQRSYGMDYAFLALLLLISLTGLALLAWRETSAMGILLAVHLGFVLAFFLVLPYSKFVHGIYRFAALVQSAQESRHKDEPIL
jgi:citrate/tricarballylate utilization protein